MGSFGLKNHSSPPGLFGYNILIPNLSSLLGLNWSQKLKEIRCHFLCLKLYSELELKDLFVDLDGVSLGVALVSEPDSFVHYL